MLGGWGRTSPTRASVIEVRDAAGVAAALESAGPRGVLPRGLGRSYGDVAQNAGGVVLDMTTLSGIEAFDPRGGTLTALAGTSLEDILRRIVPVGWFLPVTPGTRYVTLGGAIANDVHGKNHHRDGGFGDHVASLEMLTPGGDVLTLTEATDPEVFAATVGGLGLTGILLRATIRLLRIQTSRVRVDTERADDLDDLMARMSANDDTYRYSVAWVDAHATGGHLGRAVLTRGDHAALDELAPQDLRDPLRYAPRTLPSVPAGVPGVITPLTTAAFNEMWFRKAPRSERGRVQPITPFFHPLDAVGDWNRLYGRRGFVQYQFVVPFGAEEVVSDVLSGLAAARCASFLAVLKRFGPGRGMLSFPMPGWTLALDLPAGQSVLGSLLDGFDRRVADVGGRVYLAKDARLDPGRLAEMYPELERWRALRTRLDPLGRLRSDLARRLELDTTGAGTPRLGQEVGS
jgi:decaprenylphospho-beta-D-ribofuranose 2-oxidase